MPLRTTADIVNDILSLTDADDTDRLTELVSGLTSQQIKGLLKFANDTDPSKRLVIARTLALLVQAAV